MPPTQPEMASYNTQPAAQPRQILPRYGRGHTDSGFNCSVVMIALQYCENTCLWDCLHLAELWDQTEQIAISANIQFRLVYVKAHANDSEKNNVDNMCTAVILANDMTSRFQASKIAARIVLLPQETCYILWRDTKPYLYTLFSW